MFNISVHEPVDFTIYTDGSASEGMHDGGPAAVITTSCTDQQTLTKTVHQRGRLITSLYAEESDAVLMTLE